MGIKCPICGAPMEADSCGYCGYVGKKEPEMTADANNIPAQQILQPVQMQAQTNFANPSLAGAGIMPGVSRKSKTVALLLCIFLGGLGAHKFYVGKIGMGIVYLCTVGLFGVGWLIDLILIISGNYQDEFGLPLRQ